MENRVIDNHKSELERICSDPKNIFLRVALWEEYGYHDVYYGDIIAFRELEVDHIIPQGLYKSENIEELKAVLKEYNLPSDFKMNDLLNFTPTCRKPNASKGGDLIPAVICHALKNARDKKESIIRRVERYINTKNLTNSAIYLKSKLELENDIYNVIDILLDDVYDYTSVEGEEFSSDKFLMLSKSKICLRGKLPTAEELLPGCTIEFRTLLVRGMTLTIYGNEILENLCVGNFTKPDEGYRPYLLYDAKDESYYVRLTRVIFKLSVSDTLELCEHIDFYCTKYIEKLKEINVELDLDKFSFAADHKGVRILKVKKTILQDIKIFISSHNIYNDCVLEMGRHGTINGRSLDDRFRFKLHLENVEQYFWYSEQEFWLVLTMDYIKEKDGYVRQEYWAPTKVREFVLGLVKDTLSSSAERALRKKGWFRQIFEKNKVDKMLMNYLEDILFYTENVKQLICESDIKTKEDLYEIINILQEHFSITASEKRHCIDDDMGLYKSLQILLQQYELREFSVEYISKCLSCCERTCDAKKIVEDIDTFILGRNMYSDIEISNVLCCYKECIESSSCAMNYLIIKEIVKLLRCVIDRYNRDILIKKFIK